MQAAVPKDTITRAVRRCLDEYVVSLDLIFELEIEKSMTSDSKHDIRKQLRHHKLRAESNQKQSEVAN